MDQAVNHTAFGVEPAGHAIEVSCVAVFVTPPDSPRQEVSNLDEARGVRVHEHRHLGQISQISPPGAFLPKSPRQSLEGFFVVRLVHHHQAPVFFFLPVP